jgi:myo-inositol catabolism protein IolC
MIEQPEEDRIMRILIDISQKDAVDPWRARTLLKVIKEKNSSIYFGEKNDRVAFSIYRKVKKVVTWEEWWDMPPESRGYWRNVARVAQREAALDE